MAAINDLIEQIQDESLRERIQNEVITPAVNCFHFQQQCLLTLDMALKLGDQNRIEHAQGHLKAIP